MNDNEGVVQYRSNEKIEEAKEGEWEEGSSGPHLIYIEHLTLSFLMISSSGNES